MKAQVGEASSRRGRFVDGQSRSITQSPGGELSEKTLGGTTLEFTTPSSKTSAVHGVWFLWFSWTMRVRHVEYHLKKLDV